MNGQNTADKKPQTSWNDPTAELQDDEGGYKTKRSYAKVRG